MKPKIFNKVDESSDVRNGNDARTNAEYKDFQKLKGFLDRIEVMLTNCLKNGCDIAKVPKVPRDDEGYFYRYDEIMNSVPYSYSDPNVGDWLLQVYWGDPTKKDGYFHLDIPELGGDVAIATILIFNDGEVGFVYLNDLGVHMTVCTTKEEINFILSAATGIEGLDMFPSGFPAPAAPQDDAEDDVDHTYDDFFSAVMFESGQDDLDSIEEILK